MIAKRNILLVPEGHSTRNNDPRIDEVRVDPERDAPAVIQEEVKEFEATPDLQTRFAEARAAGDTQLQLDLLYEMVTGEPVEESGDSGGLLGRLTGGK